jgi:uncharacterized membrane protein
LGGSALQDASAGVQLGAAFSSTAVSSDSTPAYKRERQIITPSRSILVAIVEATAGRLAVAVYGMPILCSTGTAIQYNRSGER